VYEVSEELLMDIEHIEFRIQQIQAKHGDPEAQHIREDNLYLDFIKEIAASDSAFAEQAKLILTTQEMRFSRWCA
jgi:hypothetical protein